jgi:hypothetical protein
MTALWLAGGQANQDELTESNEQLPHCGRRWLLACMKKSKKILFYKRCFLFLA